MNDILGKLKGGDRRSIGKSGEAVEDIAKTPALFADLFAGLFDPDPVIRMRAADAVEKSTRDSPELLRPWKRALLEQVSILQDNEVRWHVAQLIPRLSLTPSEQEKAVQILMGYLNDESSIVKTFSMQAWLT
jgi:HEAT repeat protein